MAADLAAGISVSIETGNMTLEETFAGVMCDQNHLPRVDLVRLPRFPDCVGQLRYLDTRLAGA